jgi:P-type Ca2+ transporter type 2A
VSGGEQKENIMFSATDLVYGKCKGVVIKTGAETEIGKIAQALAETEDQESPLKQKLDKFGDLLTNVITVICIACWVVNIKSFGPKGMALTGKDTVDWRVWSKGAMHFFKIAIVLAVAAIPEGLPAVVTTCLALGTGRMAKRNALVRHLPAVETLGCTSIICSDKTGTLTTNQMSVQKILMIEQGGKYLEMDVDGITYEPVGEVKSKGKKVTAADHASLNELCKVASLCNQSGLFKNAQGVWERLGESTEAALKVLAEKLGAVGAGKDGDTPVHDYWASKFKKFATLEFNRERKSMSVLVGTDGEDKGTLLVKGATEMVLQRCNKVRLADGSTIALSADMRKDLIKYVEEHYASGKLALRCLAHAVLDKKLSVNDSRLQDPKKFEEVESDLTFVGLTGILDPPREEVKGAIKNCKEAGIRVMVITGDNPKTAETICRMIGIFGEDEDTTGKSFTGKDFTRMTLDEKRKAVRAARLFSRTEPIHKKDIVELLQECPPPSRTDWTRLVPSSRTDWTRLVPSCRRQWSRAGRARPRP